MARRHDLSARPMGQSLLHVAESLDPTVVRRLVDAGLDPGLRHNDGRRTALRRKRTRQRQPTPDGSRTHPGGRRTLSRGHR